MQQPPGIENFESSGIDTHQSFANQAGPFFSARNSSQVQISHPVASTSAWSTGKANSAPQSQSQAQDLSLLVENVKLMVNQLSLLQHDQ